MKQIKENLEKEFQLNGRTAYSLHNGINYYYSHQMGASNIKDDSENENKNIVKVITKDDIKNSELYKAIDFVRDPVSDKKLFVYHHIGIYGFTKNALNKYINLKRSNLELSRNLEQMRALENNMKIDVLYTDSDPLSVDTEADLEEIKNLMEK